MDHNSKNQKKKAVSRRDAGTISTFGAFAFLIATAAQASDCDSITAALNAAKGGFNGIVTHQKHENSYATSLSVQGVPCTVFSGHRNRRNLSCYQASSDAGAAKQLYAQFKSLIPTCLAGKNFKAAAEKSAPARVSDGISYDETMESKWLVQVGDADDASVEARYSHDPEEDEDNYIASIDIELES